MGNSQNNGEVRQHTITNETEYLTTEPLHLPSKGLIINFPEIDQKFCMELNSSNILFESFCKEFEKEIKLPIDAKLKYYTINSLTGTVEFLEDDYVVSNLNKEIQVEIMELGNTAKVLDVTLTLMRLNEIKLLPIKTFNFLPLKYALLFQFGKEGNFRVFKPEDTMLTQPVNLELSIRELNIDEEDCILVLYYPSPSEMLKVHIVDKEGLNVFEVDRFMRISQLNDFYNRIKRQCTVICDPETGMKVYENYLLLNFIKDDSNVVEFKGFSFDEYYKKVIEVKRTNPLENEEVKTNLLDLPD